MSSSAPALAAPNPLASLEDRECLRRYAATRDESAFRELVRRHLNLVHTAATRRLAGDAHSAKDVTQKVFTALARQAPTLPADVVLPAWLYTTTRHLAANWVRSEQSRRARERAAQLMDEINATASTDTEWDRLRPLLDRVIDELSERDRCAVLLRFFAQRSFAEIGAALQLSEDAARMRVDRALDKLRRALARRGVASSASALAGILAQNVVVAAPAELGTAVASAALAQSGTWAAAALTFMTANKVPLGLTAAAMIAGATCLTVLPRAESAPAAPSTATNETRPAVVAVVPQIERTPVRTASATEKKAAFPTTTADRLPPNISRKVHQLDALVQLSAAQQTDAATQFAQEDEALGKIPSAERPEKGATIRVGTRDQIRALLTPEQRRIYDISPQSVGGGLSIDPASLVARLDETVALTAEQKAKAREIFWADIIDQASALNGEEHLNGFRWRDSVRRNLREILSPAQQVKFDQTKPYRLNR